jgi:hypothetical protein
MDFGTTYLRLCPFTFIDAGQLFPAIPQAMLHAKLLSYTKVVRGEYRPPSLFQPGKIYFSVLA